MCVKSLEAHVTNFEILLLFFEHMYNHKLHETMMKIQDSWSYVLSIWWETTDLWNYKH